MSLHLTYTLEKFNQWCLWLVETKRLTWSWRCLEWVASLVVPVSWQAPKHSGRLRRRCFFLHNTSSAMISDCSSLLKRLERSPPASTLLMYSKKPWGKGCLVVSDGMTMISKQISTSSLMSWSVKRKVVPVPEPNFCYPSWHRSPKIVVQPVTPVVRKRFFKSSKKLVELYVLWGKSNSKWILVNLVSVIWNVR